VPSVCRYLSLIEDKWISREHRRKSVDIVLGNKIKFMRIRERDDTGHRVLEGYFVKKKKWQDNLHFGQVFAQQNS